MPRILTGDARAHDSAAHRARPPPPRRAQLGAVSYAEVTGDLAVRRVSRAVVAHAVEDGAGAGAGSPEQARDDPGRAGRRTAFGATARQRPEVGPGRGPGTEAGEGRP